MSMIRVCDLCGCMLEGEEPKYVSGSIFSVEVSKKVSLTREEAADLCPECESQIMKTIDSIYAGNPFNKNRDRIRMFVKGVETNGFD